MSDDHTAPPVVVDTSVVSILWRGDASASFYRRRLAGKRLLISFQTLEELWFGAIKDEWGDRRRNQLRRNLDQYAVIWPNREMVDISARLRSQRESAGRRLNTADAWVAATALLLQCPLATHNRDFEDIPVLELIKTSST